MSILKNAIDSIAIGLEDFQSSDERRIISSARNIFAGILLLFKHKLCELSPSNSDEVLIKQRVLPEIDATGAVRWIGKGKKTVDVQNIRERFDSLGIGVDWVRLERVNKYRNDIEHYFSALNSQSVQQLISESFLIIRDFIAEHLNKDPKQLLGDEAWAVLIEVNDVYEKEKSECLEAIEGLEFFNNEIIMAFENYSCDECGSSLIMPSEKNVEALDVEFKCKSCDKTLHYEDFVKLVIEDYFSHEVYLSHTDGGDSPITDCPECDGIYLFNEKICSSCGHVAEHECQRCSSTILPDELYSEPYCGYCAHVMSKDD
jgi:hypothetical protein